MGTTSDKLTYLNTTKQKLKQAINNLGGDITSETTFRNYVEELEGIYDNLPKTDYAEGSDITLSNTLKGKLDFEDGIVGYGQTEQESTKGYNLFTTNGVVDRTIIGVNLKSISESEILFNGTTSQGENIILKNNIFTLPSGTYTMKTEVDTSKITKPSGDTAIYLRNMSENTVIYEVTLSQLISTSGVRTSTFTLSADTNIRFQVYTNTSGIIFNDASFKFTLVSGSETKPYEPYTGGYASPSPNWEQEVKYVRGKNRFDGELLPNSYNPTTGEIEASSTSYRSNKIPLQKNETYYLSGITGNVRVLYWNNTSYVSSEVITMPNSFITKGNIIAFQFDKSLSHENIMIEKGSQATSYLPYNTIEVKARGKNLADNSKLVNGYMTAEGVWQYDSGNNFRSTDLIEVKEGKTYTSSLYNKNKERIAYLVWTTYDINKNFIAQYITTNIVISSGVKYIRARNYQAQISYIDDDDYLYQVEENNTPTNYEPYVTPQIKQLSLGEYEFAKIGNYVDTIEYDVENDKVYKNKAINKYQFTGNENFGKTGSTNLNGYVFNFPSVTTNILPPANNGTKANILSNAFITKAVDTIISEATYGIGIRSDKYLYIGAPLGSFENVSALQTYLANNITFMYYALQTEVKEEITGTLATQIKALYKAMSYTGTTILEVDGDLPMIIKARALKGESN